MSEVEATAEDVNAEPAARGGRWKLIVLVFALAAAGAGGAWYAGLLGGGGDAEAAVRVPPPIYFDVDSNMVVNFQGGGRLRYLQVGVQVMTRDPAAVEELRRHLPVLRNNLILLLSEQSYETLNTREGKTEVQQAALAEVQALLGDGYQGSGIEAVYFTSFVMQ